ncbi:MAG: cytochrome c-type bioproteinis protein CcmF [Gammaproteobacteria bacterium]|nr:MAG: cytochrome c-type bioproteinis protein CcmF [Gammaproteobacteria bacterium]TND06210.1 MAG: cytochrome c-type bioproteinis protein CcmF [Gammaproteobacteria bacterium]
MIPEIGHFALITALCLALIQGIVPLIGTARSIPAWIAIARPAAQGQFVFVAVAFACLTYAFISHDFSVQYVAMHSNSALPIQYRIAGVWGGHEGSLLLWALMLGGWTVAVTLFSRHLPDDMVARVIAVMGLVSIGFLLFMLITSNPFERLLPAPADGQDLNPLLQDPGLVIHPPMLYMGYVGFSVAYAFAIAALISGRLDATWARWSRPWTTVAWSILTCGIALGSWWAYYELGWGGWWFWDPVENASFMPWLVGTALIHSLAVTEKRGAFKSWTVLLAIFAFALSLLGTFLVRSGVLTSVHAFATDPERGLFILVFLGVVVGGSLTLFGWRAAKVGLGGKFELVSRETFLLSNNVLMVAAAGTVLLGTLYPLLLDALDLGKISVGPPYFNSVFVPLMVPAIFLMGLAPLARWKKQELPELLVRVRWAFGAGVVTALILPFVMGRWTPLISLGLLLAFWLIFTIGINLRGRLRDTGAEGILRRVAMLPRAYVGMNLAHFGVAVFVIGVTLVQGYQEEKDVFMKIGDTTDAGGYTFRFDGVIPIQGSNYQAQMGMVRVLKDGKDLFEMNPEKRVYNVQKNPMTEAAIDTGLFRDLYVSLGEPVSDGAWSVRIYYKPFVDWVWGGCALMALGGLLAVSDRRYRVFARRTARIEPGVPGAAEPVSH